MAINRALAAAVLLLAVSVAAAKPKMDYMIVSNEHAVGPYHLKGATGTEKRFATGPRKRFIRAIFEVKDHVVQLKPRRSPNNFWNSQADVKKMHKFAVRRYVLKRGFADKQLIKVAKHKVEYMVVSNEHAVGPYHLKGATGTEHKFATGPRKKFIRAIFEVHNGVVQLKPRKSTNNFWNSDADVKKMYRYAVARYVKKFGGAEKQLLKPEPAPKIEYMVVSNEHAVGPYHLKGATGTEHKFATGPRKKFIRAIYEVHDGVVQLKPRKSTNNFWNSDADVKKMYKYAVARYVKKHGGAEKQLVKPEPEPTPEPKPQPKSQPKSQPKTVSKARPKGKVEYMVVSNDHAVGPYHLKGAEGTEHKFATGPRKKFIRAIFPVVDGVVQHKPRRSVNNFWNSPADVKKMYKYAVGRYVKKHGGANKQLGNPQPLKKGKVEYIVVSNEVAVGPYPLKGATSLERHFATGPRKRFIRAIFPVVNEVVQHRPRRSTNNFWNSPADVQKMYKVAVGQWDNMRGAGNPPVSPVNEPKVSVVKNSAPQPNGKIHYVVVSGDRPIVPHNLKMAKTIMRSVAEHSGRRKLNRAIFEVHNGVVQVQPRKSTYSKWNTPADIMKMYKVAVGEWVKVHGGADKQLCAYGDACNGKPISGPKGGELHDSCGRTFKIEKTCALKPLKPAKKPADKLVKCVYGDACNGKPISGPKGGQLHDSCGRTYSIDNECRLKPVVIPADKPLVKKATAVSPRTSSLVTPIKATTGASKNSKAFYVVAGNEAQGPFTLPHAKNILLKYPQRQVPPSRAIFEVKDGAVLKDPHRVGGENQADGLRAGFNKFWHDWHDINRMWSVANMLHDPQPKAPEYFVNVGDVVKGPFSLPAAKKILKRYPPDSPSPIRAVFEVKGGVVQKDPRHVGSENQGVGPRAGFNKYWKGQPDINRMYRNVKSFYKNPVPGPDFPAPEKPGPAKFYVAVGDVAGGPVPLTVAKRILNMYPPGATYPSRAIFELKNGKIKKNPNRVGGENQKNGLKAGFNKYWKGKQDKDRMYKIVNKFFKNPVPGPGFPSPNQPPPNSDPVPNEGPVTGKGPKTATSPRSVITADAVKGAQIGPKPGKGPNPGKGPKPGKDSKPGKEPKPESEPKPENGPKPGKGPKPTKVQKIPKSKVVKTNKMTGKMPTTCNCVTEAAGTGQCYSFNKGSSKYCTARACEPKYVCVTRNTGVTCLRHKVTSKVAPSAGKDGVPIVDGTCTKQAASGDIYVPYS